METALFYIASTISLIATMLVVTRTNASHALIYLIVSLLSIAVIFYLLGAPFSAALEIVIYAGAIMVFYLFVVMMLNLGPSQTAQERRWLEPRMWIGPGLLTLVLFLEVIYMLAGSAVRTAGVAVDAKVVGERLFTTYLLGVELAGFLLLAALVGSYHVGRRYMRSRREEIE